MSGAAQIGATQAWRPTIVVVGGFLGAGKTSLILHAARILSERGIPCAIVMNDQGRELVDTHYAELQGVRAAEVTGGCFCCRFSQLLSAIEELRAMRPEVIFAEPVGSCTDIAATVLEPLRQEFESYRIAPFTVLVDPARAAALDDENPDPDVDFLFRKQLQEADLVCLTKADLHTGFTALPGIETRSVSTRTGQGVPQWIDEVLLGSKVAGSRSLEINYDRYARAEAALAWLNLSFSFVPEIPAAAAAVAGPFLDGLDHALTAAEIPILHLKLIDTSSSGWLKAALCANGEEPLVEGALDASPANRHELLLNLRAIGDPAVMRVIINSQLNHLRGQVRDVQLDCFSPAPPVPERRITSHRGF